MNKLNITLKTNPVFFEENFFYILTLLTLTQLLTLVILQGRNKKI